MKEHLQIWYSKWLEENKNTDLEYVDRGTFGPYLQQVHFVRDDIAHLVLKDIPYEQLPIFEIEEPYGKPPLKQRLSAYVVGEHISKSVRLPVFMFEREDIGLRFVIRYNFYDWNISIETSKDVPVDVIDGFDLDTKYCFFQGFPKEYRFKGYNENKRKFSMYIGSAYQLYTLIWLIMRWVQKELI